VAIQGLPFEMDILMTSWNESPKENPNPMKEAAQSGGAISVLNEEEYYPNFGVG
jgi:hypothetical protein